MKLRELTTLTGVAERQVRYLIAEGFMPAPRGGRATADYGDEHVEAIRRYTRLRDLGFSPAAVRVLLQARHGAPFPVAPGLTLLVDPQLIGTEADVEALAERLRRVLNDLFKEPSRAHDRTAVED